MTAPSAAPTYAGGVEQAMQRSVAVFVVLVAALWSSSIAAFGASMDTLLTVVCCGFTAMLLVVGRRAWRSGLGTADVAATTAGATVMIVVAALSRPSGIAEGTSITASTAAAILAAGLLQGVPVRLVPAGILLAQFLGEMPHQGAVTALVNLWVPVASATASRVCSATLRSAAHAADQAQAELATAKAHEARAAGQRAAHQQFQRMLHDDIATALRAVAGPGVLPEEARAMCATAITAAERVMLPVGSQVKDLTALVASLRPLFPSVTIVTHGDGRVPAPVADAFLAAAGEALRNARRHADATTVTLLLDGRDDEVRLSVSDDGRGFAPGRCTTSWGVPRSMTARMAEVSGTAEVTSRNGAGTVVDLAWRRPARPAEPAREPARPGLAESISTSTGDVRRHLAAACLPFQVAMFLLAVQHGGRDRGWDRFTLWYLAVTAVVTGLAVRANRPLPGWAGTATILLALGGQVPALMALPADSIADYRSWPIGALTPLYVVLLMVRPVRETVLLVAADEITLLTLVATGALRVTTLAAALPAVLSPVIGAGMMVVLLRTITRLGSAATQDHRERLAVALATSDRQARLALHRRRLQDIGSEIIPFLTEVATDTDRDWTRSQQRARKLDALTRDELQLPGVLDAALRSRFADIRSRGGIITIQSDGDVPAPAHVLRDLLTMALRSDPAPRQVTLSLYPAGDDLAVALVTVPGDTARCSHLRQALSRFGADLDDSAEATRVTCILSGLASPQIQRHDFS